MLSDDITQRFLKAHDPGRRFWCGEDQPFPVDLVDQEDDGLAHAVDHRNMVAVSVFWIDFIKIKIEIPFLGGNSGIKMIGHANDIRLQMYLIPLR